MSDTPRAEALPALHRRGLSSLLSRWLLAALRNIAFGKARIVLPDGATFVQAGGAAGANAEFRITRWRAVWRLLTGGELGFAQAYIEGNWSTPDLLAALTFAMQNEHELSRALASGAVRRVLSRLAHWSRRNTRGGSRRNISAHYDLGNAFYAEWLDRGMNYSSALFANQGQSLEDAQTDKLDLVGELLDPRPGDRVLEIGCGWGALAGRLSRESRFTGLTLSAEQLAYSRKRLQDAGLDADLRLQDYRDIEGRFDRIVSIEMIEAVGEKYWPTYFRQLGKLLAPGGTVVLQAITIDESRFEPYFRQPDFIQRYIFPGGMLPTEDAIYREARAAGLEVVRQIPFGESYAQTLECWRMRFLASWHAVEALGFDQRFKRMWLYYLCYCEVGFRNSALEVSLFKLVAQS